jgi:cell fate regulator YaaT (PSP1 superfamily)
MPLIVGVRFRPATKVYYFDPAGLEDLCEGDYVLVETSRARELGKVVIPPREVPPEEVVGKLKPIVGRATAVDLASAQHYATREEQALTKCRGKVEEHNLPIKVIHAEYNYDGSHLTFCFTAEKRVDFRALVRDLARLLRTRIELRQVGVRDEAKLIAGFGPCGQPLCCATHLCEFIPVSIKMAKQQDLPLSPMEISGMCGRLMCCLTYENEFYSEAQAKMPRRGDTIVTPDGAGKVKGINVIKETVEVELESGTVVEVPLDETEAEPSRRERRGE